jgi:hypothetical protein
VLAATAAVQDAARRLLKVRLAACAGLVLGRLMLNGLSGG